MVLDLAQFHDAFFEESFEALDSMESALLELDLGAPDAERISAVFRVAHSIKGGSATFGFKEVAAFTHAVETLLDELRGQRMQVTQALSDLLLKSVDAMRGMLTATQSEQPVDAQVVAAVQGAIEQAIVHKGVVPSAPVAASVATAVPPAVAPMAASPRGWQIRFRPLPES
jgi:two-component system chemotaxis sensor kinase CheA